MSVSFVAVLMGSKSDFESVERAVKVLKRMEIPVEVKVTSAHRCPNETVSYVTDAESRGCQVFIAAAGLAAHLAGVVAAHTTRPVIGIPMAAGPLSGLDSLLSTVQMPSGVPVATVAIGNAGAGNAGYLAAQILALADPAIADRLRADRQAQVEKVQADSESIQASVV